MRLDEEYREQAAAGVLPTVALPRDDPDREAWVPLWRVDADDFHFTVRFSTTRLAHDLDEMRDWVVVSWDRDGKAGHATVVTEYRGPLRGRRVVRGREHECLALRARAADEAVHRGRLRSRG